MMKLALTVILSAALLAGCAETSIQPLTQSSFKVATVSECGAKGTREIAFKAAAIEVIRRGGDRFVIVGDGSGSTVAGGQYVNYGNGFGSFQTYNVNNQDMIVQLTAPNDPNALSARQTLGADWQAIVAEGVPQVCT